jgi:hypothetical protein
MGYKREIDPQTGRPYELAGAQPFQPPGDSLSAQFGEYGAYGPPDSQMQSILGTAGGITTTAGMTTANPFLVGAGLAMQAGQMGLDVYGNYKEQQRQEQALKEQKIEMERRRRIEEEDRKYQKYLNRLAQAQNIGQYSQGLEDRSLDRYSKYVT